MPTSDTIFEGSVPDLYDDLLAPMIFEGYATDLAARVAGAGGAAPRTVLETAAGTGVLTRALVRALPPSTRIVATDLNPDMIAVGARRAAAPNVTWQRADAQSLPFDDAAFDAVACEFGMMFPPDKAALYAEAARVLAPGGRFVFNVWDRLENNEVSKVVAEAVARQFPSDPPRFFERTPFAYWDEARLRADAAAARFARVDFDAIELTTRTSATAAATGLCQGTPLRNEIEARRPGSLAEVTARAAEALVARFGGPELDNRMRAIVVSAVK